MILNIILPLLFLILCIVNPAYSETQLELNKAACSEKQKADDDLNNVYYKVLTKYKNDVVFLDQFIKAQKKWIEFRNASLATMYLPQKKDSYGSVLPMCQCYFLKNITKNRVKELKAWVDGVEEGDVCTGTVIK